MTENSREDVSRNPNRPRILVIDDDQVDRLAVRRFARGRFEVCEAGTCAEGLRKFLQIRHDCVLLDYQLPDCDGLDLLDTLRQHHATVVVLTRRGSEKVAAEAIKRGAEDYLVKDLLTPESLALAVQKAMEKAALREVQAEMLAARRIHKSLLPDSAPELFGFDIAGRSRATAMMAGDFYDFIPLPDGALDVIIADASGHGFGPALIMAGARRVLRTLAPLHDDVGGLLTITNAAVDEDTEPFEFVTLFYARIDPRQRKFVYAGAGHPAYLFDLSGGVRTLDRTTLPLGIAADTQITPSEEIDLPSGSLLLLLTDGLEDTFSPTDEPFGIARAWDIVRENRHRPAEEIVDALHRAAIDHSAPDAPHDDVTVVVVKVK